jgi:SAM-dependent methyltransferase
LIIFSFSKPPAPLEGEEASVPNVDRSLASEFEDEDVVTAYMHRPPYPDALIGRLLELIPVRGRVLDLGCGLGKLALALAPHVEEVIAVDRSAAMLRLAQALDAGDHPNVRWMHDRAEALDLDAPFDLAGAGAAIHWIDPAVLFPKLARWLAPGACLAIVEGDAPTAAPWIEAYHAVIHGWVERLGARWNDEAYQARATAHEAWIDVHGRETFAREVHHRIDDLIVAEHSRATWARRRMGALAEAFDADLRSALTPWATDGVVSYLMETRLVWGDLRTP